MLDEIFCVDASPDAAGICRAKVGRTMAAELWRRGERIGYRAQLLRPRQADLRAAGHPDDMSSDDGEGEPAGAEDVDRGQWSEGFSDLCSRAVAQRRELSRSGEMPGPPWDHFPEDFDLIELYGGAAEISKQSARRGLRVGPILELKRGFDMEDRKVFSWLMFMVLSRRVWMLVWEPPCTTASLARKPNLRTLAWPDGLDMLEELTCQGNLHMYQSLLLGLLQGLCGGAHAGEQPAWGFFRAYVWWQHLADRGEQLLFDWCRYGRPWRKTTRLLTGGAPWLRTLARRCACEPHYKHTTLQGSLTTAASAYSVDFGIAFAEACAGQREAAAKYLDKESASHSPAAKTLGRHVSHLWAVHLAEAVPWKPMLVQKFHQAAHINLLESRARRYLLQLVPRDSKVFVGQDSKVCIGSLCHGRSSSVRLNRELSMEAPYMIGKNLHIVAGHMPTWAIRADDVSRSVAVRPPRISLPPWALWLRAGRIAEAAAALDRCSGGTRALGRWALLGGAVLLSAARHAKPPGRQAENARVPGVRERDDESREAEEDVVPGAQDVDGDALADALRGAAVSGKDSGLRRLVRGVRLSGVPGKLGPHKDGMRPAGGAGPGLPHERTPGGGVGRAADLIHAGAPRLCILLARLR